MRILILHQVVPADAPPDECDVLVQAQYVAQALVGLGHAWAILPVDLPLAALREQVLAAQPECVFNLVESLAGADRLMALVPAALDAIGVRYTGSPAQAIIRTNNKVFAKEQMRAAGLPTADWATSESGELTAPYIVKAISEHASLGLDESAIVKNAEFSVQNQIQRQADRLGCECFAEAFIAGREFNVSLLAGSRGPQVLPLAEIDFAAFKVGQPRIVGYAAKWDEGSFEYQHTPREFVDQQRESELCETLSRLACDCWQLFGLRGYARVDFRVDESGKPWILEVNCNPCLSPDAGFAAALEVAGIRWEDAIARILVDS